MLVTTVLSPTGVAREVERCKHRRTPKQLNPDNTDLAPGPKEYLVRPITVNVFHLLVPPLPLTFERTAEAMKPGIGVEPLKVPSMLLCASWTPVHHEPFGLVVESAAKFDPREGKKFGRRPSRDICGWAGYKRPFRPSTR